MEIGKVTGHVWVERVDPDSKERERKEWHCLNCGAGCRSNGKNQPTPSGLVHTSAGDLTCSETIVFNIHNS